MSSIDAKLSSKGQSAYSGSKAALSASIKTISKEVAPNGIRLNCVLPSMISTPMTNYVLSKDMCLDKTDHNNKDVYPFGWGEPNDVANMVVYLLSAEAKYISGQNYIIDSGGVL